MTATTVLVPRRETHPVPSGAGGVPVFWSAAAFEGPVRGMIAPAGTSLAEIIARARAVDPALDRTFAAVGGAVTVNGMEIPPPWWPRVRVRCGTRRVVVVLHPGLGKGGGNVLGAVLQLAALVAAIAIAGPFGVPAALGLTQATANLIALGLTVGTSLLAAALSPPPTQFGASPGANAQLGRAGISGNALAPSAPVARLTGEIRYAPSFACAPYSYIVGDDEYVEACYALAGPTALAEIRLGNVAVEDMADAELEIREGRPGDAPPTLIDRVTATDSVGIEISRPQVDPDDGSALADQQNPEKSLPVWHSLIGGRDADEIVITLSCSGLIDLSGVIPRLSVPMRVRIRRRGAELWINLPEVHWQSSNGREFRKIVRLSFGVPPVFESPAPAADGPVLAFRRVPDQTINPARPGYTAAGYFHGPGTGGDVMSAATFGTHKVRHVTLEKDGVTFNLDPDIFPLDAYEIEIKFGCTYNTTQFTPESYLLNGGVYDLFGFYSAGSTYRIARSRANLRDELGISRCVTIWHENPLPQPDGIASISLRIKNRQLGELTVLGAGLVPEWDGVEWSGLATTRNPAPHMRQRLAELMPVQLVDDVSLIAWQGFCTAETYETCAVLLDGSVFDGLNLVASAGRGRLRASERIGVLYDRDTSAEATVQTISMRNGRDLVIVAPMAEKIGGFRVRFKDRSRDHRENTVIVLNPNAAEPGLPLEERVDQSLDDEGQVVKRALFDLLQYQARANSIVVEVPAYGLRSERGDLIAIQHDVLTPFAGAARIVEIVFAAGLVSGLRLDGTVPTPADQAFSNIAAAWSNYAAAFAAARLGVSIRLTDLSELKKEIVAAGDVSDEISFVTPFVLPPGLAAGCHLVSGLLGSETRRVKISSIEPKGGMEYRLTCVDEANEIHVNG